jgi:hypothetical protein
MLWIQRLSRLLHAPTGAKSNLSAPVRVALQGIPTVKFDPSPVSESVKVNLRKSVELLDDLDKRHVQHVYEVALRSILVGFDAHLLYTELLIIEGISKKRAREISLSLHRKSHSQIDRERHTALGFTHAKWMSPHAPCMVDPRHPSEAEIRQDAAHKAANGKIYDLSEGLLVDGKWTWPEIEDGCKCVSRPILPGSRPKVIYGHTGGNSKLLGWG